MTYKGYIVFGRSCDKSNTWPNHFLKGTYQTMPTTPYTKIMATDSVIQIPSFQQGFNRRWFAGQLEAVYLCHTGEGVALALEDAISHYGDKIKVKGGGHCYEDFVYNEATLAIIDVGPLNEVGHDPEKGYYLGSGGTNWSAFKALFRDFGKVLPAGSCYSVGLGGHICGGGYGLLSRLNGLTVDWLTGVDIAVKPSAGAPARLHYVSKDSLGAEADLYWAQLGGGGGNFGVIARYYFKELPDAPQRALITTISWDWSQVTVDMLGGLLDWYAAFASREDNWSQFGLLKLNHKAAGEIQMIVQTAYSNDLAHFDRHEALLNELRAFGEHGIPQKPILGYGGIHVHPASDPTVDYTFYEAVQILNGSGANQRGKYKSAYMRKPFPPEQVQAIYEHLQVVPAGLTEDDMKQSLLQVDTYGGIINTVPSEATAIAQRSSIMKLQYQTYWTFEQNDQAHLDWIRGFYQAMYQDYGGTPNPASDPSNNVDGCYFNYCDADLNDLVGRDGALRLYFLENLERLVATKSTWDPNNYFNSKQSIPVSLG